MAVTDLFGDEAGTQNFYPFGEVRTGTGIFDTERGFTGQIFDAGTGLGFYNARYYDTLLDPDALVKRLAPYEALSRPASGPASRVESLSDCQTCV